MAFETLFNPILGPLLSNLGPFFTLLIVSLVVSIITTVVYKYATNQDRLRVLKADLKRYQAKAKALKDNPEKMMKVQKDIMRLNGEYMKSSFKSTIYTFLPIIIFFSWLAANLAFAPILPGSDFGVTVELEDGVTGFLTLNLVDNLTSSDNLTKEIYSPSLSWKGISGEEGIYDFSITHSPSGEEQFISVKITEEQAYLTPLSTFSDSDVFSTINVDLEKLRIFKGVFILEHIPWIKNFNWFWAYFLFSLIFSTSLRKAMKLA